MINPEMIMVRAPKVSRRSPVRRKLPRARRPLIQIVKPALTCRINALPSTIRKINRAPPCGSRGYSRFRRKAA